MSTEPQPVVASRTVRADGLEIHYRETGHGRPVILLHGGTSSSNSWLGYALTLARHFHILMPDTRGHGRTPDPGGEMSYAQLADDVAAFSAALDLDKPVVCGFSDGGQSALELGMRHPDLAAAFVVAGAFYKFSENYLATLSQWGFLGAGNVDIPYIKRGNPGAVEWWRSEHSALGGDDYWQTLLRSLSTAWLTPFEYTAADLGKITAPTLVLLGDRDETIPVQQAVEMYEMLPNSELAILPNATHEGTITGPEGINPHFLAVVSDFLLRNASRL